MITSIFQAILDNLNKDSILTGYIGANHCYRARMVAPSIIPSVTLMQNNEKSDQRVGYNASKHRDSTPTIQIDVWVSSNDETFPCTGEDADLIANRIDEVILNPSTPITGTYGWSKDTESQQHDNEVNIWHNALRYSFSYNAQD